MTKSDFRTECLKKLRNASPSTKSRRDAIVRTDLAHVLEKINPKRVLFFWPMTTEPDIRKLILTEKTRREVYLPFMDGVSFKMVPLRYPLEKRSFGIMEPRDSNKKNYLIDVAIVPVVGVDGDFRRIGFGKGMYDRFFPTLKARPFTIFVQACECRTLHRVSDTFDVRADLLITPRGVYGVRNFYVKRTSRRGWDRSPQRVGRIFNF